MNLKITLLFAVLGLFGESLVWADLVTSWDLGEKVEDFSAFRINSSSGVEEAVNWSDESGADVYVVSTCAMWCGPCQQFAIDSQSLVNSMANEGISVEVYDFIFENSGFLEPSAVDAQAWLDNIWTGDPDNVWFGGDILVSASDSVTVDIFEALENAGIGSANAPGIPGIAILDRNGVVRDLQTGYVAASVADSVRAAAVPEPSSFSIVGLGVVSMLLFHRRRRP